MLEAAHSDGFLLQQAFHDSSGLQVGGADKPEIRNWDEKEEMLKVFGLEL